MLKCPLCDNSYKESEDLYLHMEKVHSDIIPEDYTPSRYLYQLKTGKSNGNCVMCKKPTGWNERTNKYHRFCENPKCKEKYREIFKERMIGKHGKVTLLDDPEQQKKMLANRRISGTYKIGKQEVGYTGTYELDFLKMLDNLLDWDENDIMSPSPHTYWYEYEGVRRFYIPDFYIPSLNLEVEIKDGGDNPNMHPKIQAVDKEKERLKDSVMISQERVSYIKIMNKQYGTFFTFLNKAKENFAKGFKEKPVFLLESTGSAELVNEGGLGFTLKNIDIVMSNMMKRCKSTGNFKAIQPNLLKLVKRAKTLEDIRYLRQDASTVPYTLQKMSENIPEISEQCKEHAEWVKNVYKPAINNRAREIRDTMTESSYNNDNIPESSIDSSPYSMEATNWKYNPKDTLIPVYVLLTYTNSMMAKAIKKVTKQPYSHAGISLDSTLSQIFTYGRKTADDICKFTDENIFSGLLGENRDMIKYALYVTFFENRQIQVLQQHIENIKSDINQHKYSYKGLINFMFGKETHDEGMFCSQFVASVIKAGDPNRLKRDASLYSPTDLKQVKGMHFVTKGVLGNYNKDKVDEIVNNIKVKLLSKERNDVIESAMPRVSEELLSAQSNIVDFANIVNECTDVDVLIDSKYYINNEFCKPIIENRVANILSNESSTITKDENLFVILESSTKRHVNGKLIAFNPSDIDTRLYTVSESSENNITNFTVNRYNYQRNMLVLESADIELPEDGEDNVIIGFKIKADRTNIDSILENFTDVKLSPAIHTGVILDTKNDEALTGYMQSVLESIGAKGFSIERYK